MQIYIAKADKEINVDFDAFPANSVEYIVRYGLTQALSDAAASIKGDSDNAPALTMALVEKRLKKLVDGEPPEMGQRSTNPVMNRAVEKALVVVKARWQKANKKLDPKGMRVDAIALVKSNPAYMHLAQSDIDREKAELAEIVAAEEAAIGRAVDELVPMEEYPEETK